MDTTTDIYWAVIRNQTVRSTYIELEFLGGKRWNAVLGDQEFKFRTEATEFFEVLEAALLSRPAL
jgi:hypothetical protein